VIWDWQRGKIDDFFLLPLDISKKIVPKPFEKFSPFEETDFQENFVSIID